MTNRVTAAAPKISDVRTLQHGVAGERIPDDRCAQQVGEVEPAIGEEPRMQRLELRDRTDDLRRHRQDRGRRHRADRHGRQRREEQPDRRETEERDGDVRGDRQKPHQAFAHRHLRSREQRHRPDREQHPPHQRADDHHRERPCDAERRRGQVLDDQQAHPTGRCEQQVPERAVAGLARDRVTRRDAHRERQEERDRDRHGREPDEQPVVRDLVEEGGPASRARPAHEPDRDPDEDRDQRERAEHRPRAPPPELRRQLVAEQLQRARPAAGRRRGPVRLCGHRHCDLRRRHRSPPR